MYGLLQRGPAAHQQIWVDDPPAETITVEVIASDDDCLVPMSPAGEVPEVRFESHVYRRIGIDRVPSPIAPGGAHRLAIYMHAPELASL